MEVKTLHEEYKDWKTELQWAKEGKKVINKELKKELWINGYCKVKAEYVSPDNVRDMTDIDKKGFLIYETEKKRRQREEAKERRKQEEEEELYWCKKREEWHTDWQWYELGRKAKDTASYTMGKHLNHREDDSSPFGREYFYCHIDDTEEFIDEADKEATYKKLYKETYGKDPE